MDLAEWSDPVLNETPGWGVDEARNTTGRDLMSALMADEGEKLVRLRGEDLGGGVGRRVKKKVKEKRRVLPKATRGIDPMM